MTKNRGQNRPRIGIDVTSAITQGGGIGRYTRELVQALNKANKQFEFAFFSAKPPDELQVKNQLPSGPKIGYFPTKISERWLYRLWYRLRLPLSIQRFIGPIDLFHSPDFVLPPISGNIPSLLTVHDLSFVHFPEAFTPALNNYLQRVVPWSIERATHVMADSEATRRDLVDLWEVPPEKVTVLYSGVSNRFKPITDDKRLRALRRKYELGDEPYLFSVGTVQPRKNYQMLIRAFKDIAHRIPQSLFIAGGRGWLYEEILAEVNQLGLTDRVRFLGFVDDEDLPGLYSNADLFLFPSLYEGFGLPLLEAMACGVAVISSNSSSLPEVLGEAGLALDPNDIEAWSRSMLTLLEDSSRKTTFVARGFMQVRGYTWERSAVQLLEKYQDLLAS